MSLRVQNLSSGMRVRKIKGEGADKDGTVREVRAVDVENNTFAVLFDGDQKPTFRCDPEEFILLGPPPGTVPRHM